MPEAFSERMRLLLVTYWYPPAVGAAAQRMHAFARYLPAHGFEVHVLTAERPSAPKDKCVTLHTVEDPLADGTPLMPDYDSAVMGGRLASMVRDLVFPDRFLHWAHAAIIIGKQILRRHRIDAIMVSFPPASAAMAALTLAEESGLPLVLDVRDRWIGPGGYAPQSAAARGRHAALERQAVSRSAAVVTVSEALADAIADEQTYPRERIWVIPNGYDPTAPPSSVPLEDKKASRRLTIAHVGTVIARNRPDLFFDSLRRLKESDALVEVRFRFIGNLSHDYVRSLGLADAVETTGLVSHEQSLIEMRQSDALLLLTGEYVGRWGYSAKLFEYLRARRPILCLEESPGSNDRAMLDALAPERCFYAALADAGAIREAICRLHDFVRMHPEPLKPPEGLARFCRETQTSELARRLLRLRESE